MSLLVSVSLSMADHLSSSIHSLVDNAIGEEGEAAIRAAAKETGTEIL